jgi:hypothetical protein
MRNRPPIIMAGMSIYVKIPIYGELVTPNASMRTKIAMAPKDTRAIPAPNKLIGLYSDFGNRPLPFSALGLSAGRKREGGNRAMRFSWCSRRRKEG